MTDIDYTKNEIPKDYKCGYCGATNCKLWRDHSNCSPLKCATCAAKDQNKNIDDLDSKGTLSSNTGGRTNQIGWFLPAVPVDDKCLHYWSYARIPKAGGKWWENLTTHPAPPK